MENIIDKSKKDLKRLGSRPVLSDIVTVKGFLRYFAYRTTFPFFRDLIFFVFDTTQIFIIFKLLGFGASTGGVLGYAFVVFMSGFWTALVYSMREKVLTLGSQKNYSSISSYFSPLISSGAVIWVIIVVISLFMFRGLGIQPLIIFSSRIISHGIELYSMAYFFTAYTITRIYIPFWATVLNRLVFLIVPIFLITPLGVWAFVFSFFIERLLSLLITVKYSNKSLRARGIDSFNTAFFSLAGKKMFWFIREGYVSFVKRIISFSLMNFQRLLFLAIVSKYFYFYLLDFFAFYQLLHLFFLVPQRIGKSLYYDVTFLLHRGRYHLTRLLCNYDIVMSLLLASLVVSFLYFVPIRVVPFRLSSIIIELAVIDQWSSIYMLVFFSFGIIVVQRVFILSESYYSYIFGVLLFDYFILAYMAINSPYIFGAGNPVFIFALQGKLSFYYFLSLLLWYFVGLWRKESIVYSANKNNKFFDLQTTFLEKTKQKNKCVVAALFLSDKYSYRNFPELVADAAKDVLNVVSVSKLNRSLVFVCAEQGDDIHQQELNVVSRLGVYCDSVVFAKLKDFVQKFSDQRSFEGFKYSGKTNLAIAEEYLHSLKLTYRIYSANNFTLSKRKKQIYDLLGTFKEGDAFMPKHLVLKKDFLGLIPIIEQGHLVSFIELEKVVDIKVVEKLIKELTLNEFYDFVFKISNG